MSSKLEIKPDINNLQDLIGRVGDLTKPIGELAPVTAASLKAEAGIKFTQNIGNQGSAKVTFDLGIEANAAIDIFNAANDEDRHGVFAGAPPKEETRTGDRAGEFKPQALTPVLLFEKPTAWSKFWIQTRPVLKANFDIPFGTAKIEADAEVIFADYHKHKSSEKIGAALIADAGNLRIAADVDHIIGLPAGDALFYNVRGALDAAISLKWSDTFAYALPQLSALIAPGQLLAINIGASAALDFNVYVRDDFRVIFTKHTDGRNRVAVKRAKSSGTGLNITLAVEAKFADEKQWEAALNKLYLAVVGDGLGQINGLVKKIDDMVAQVTSFGGLTDEQKEIALALAKRFGLAELTDTVEQIAGRWDAIKNRWTEVQQIIPGAIKQLVKAKAALTFKYEYLRTHDQEELAVALLTDAGLRNIHQGLLVLSLNELVKESQRPGNELVSYLNQKLLTVREAWGFTLNLGKWVFKGQDTRELKVFTQENAQGQKRISFDGLRRYDGNSPKDQLFWTANFTGGTEEFAGQLDYGRGKFKTGLHLLYFTMEKKLGDDELRDFIDQSLLWESLAPQGVEAAMKLRPNPKKRAEMKCEITIEDTELREIARAVHNMTEAEKRDRMYRAFAAALPFDKDYGATRRLPKMRETIYAPLWKMVFEEQGLSLSQIRATVSNHLRNNGNDGALLEKNDTIASFTTQLQLHDKFKNATLTFLKGMEELHDLLNETTPGDFTKDRFVDVFKSLRDMWAQWLFVRACGVFLLGAARESGSFAQIKRTSSITTGEGDSAVTTLLAAGAR